MFGEGNSLRKILEKRSKEVNHPVTFESLEDLVKNNEELEKMFDEIVESASRYFEAVARFDRVEIMRFKLDTDKFQEMMQNIDKARRRTHNGLIDRVNILSRRCGDLDVSNDWRRYFGFDEEKSREKIGLWSLDMTYNKQKKQLEEKLKTKKEQAA